jgi:diadenosine tetraphosphatase ApaH/serine/threonine PP2A family protein phosphatase
MEKPFQLKFNKPAAEKDDGAVAFERGLLRGVRYALFSDVHANLEAVEAVVRDMMELGITDRICLGDIVGYAADPSSCVDFVQGLGCPTLLGNHDIEVAGDQHFDSLNIGAKAGIDYARKQLDNAQKSFLRNRPYALRNDHFEATHASLHSPSSWRYVIDEAEAQRHFKEQAMQVCFFGHTHYPCVWEEDADGHIELYAGMTSFRINEGYKYLINIGSVGQPRDRNNKACYVVYFPEEKRVIWRRVEYPIKKAQQKIHDAGLPEKNATRLDDGR